MQVAGKATTGQNAKSDTARQGTEPTMRDIFKPSKRIGKDSSAKPMPQQPKAKKRFRIGKD